MYDKFDLIDKLRESRVCGLASVLSETISTLALEGYSFSDVLLALSRVAQEHGYDDAVISALEEASVKSKKHS